MKLTAVSILKWNGDASPNLCGLAADLSSFGFFQRGSVKEMLVFVSRTVAQRTQPGQRQTVQSEEYFCHVHNRDGCAHDQQCVVLASVQGATGEVQSRLVGIAFVDKEYPPRAAFGVVNKVLDEFSDLSQNKWRSATEDNTDALPVLDPAIIKYQVQNKSF